MFPCSVIFSVLKTSPYLRVNAVTTLSRVSLFPGVGGNELSGRSAGESERAEKAIWNLENEQRD